MRGWALLADKAPSPSDYTSTLSGLVGAIATTLQLLIVKRHANGTPDWNAPLRVDDFRLRA
jgi:hypothetical protein